LKTAVLIWTLGFTGLIKAQFIPCVDSIRANAMFQCNDPAYIPVCGCNGITYRNQCAAYNVGGVSDWTSGVCAGIDMDFFPNPIGPNSELSINLSFPEFFNGDITLRLVDLYGKTYEQKFFYNVNRMSFQIDMNPMMTGIYFIVVTGSNGGSLVRMLSKN